MLVLTVLQGPDKGRVFELPANEPQMIGRSSESLPLSDTTISRCHCELTPDEGKWHIRDLNSANGTYVNGRRVSDMMQLQVGDQLRTGNTLMVYGRDVEKEYGVAVVDPDFLTVNVERTVSSADESIVLAVPEPRAGAVNHLKVIYDLTELIGSVTSQDELLEKIMDQIFQHFRADRGFIMLIDEGMNPDDLDKLPVPTVVRHRVEPKDQESAVITVSKTIVQHVMREREGVLSSNAQTDERFKSGDSVRNYGIRSALCVPIKYKDQIFGVIHLDSKILNYTFTDDQLNLLTAIGVQTGLAIANVRLYAEHIKAEKLAAIGQTVASLSHSIKNILQGLRGGADVVGIGLKKQNMEVVGNGWKIVSRNLDRIMDLTMNMLTFSKRRVPEFSPCSIPDLLQEIVELVQGQFDEKSVALITDIDGEVPEIYVDPEGLHQAILNLLNNAMDAVSPDVGLVTLRTKYAKGSTVDIQILDNGTGISKSEQASLFEPFYSTKGLKGTGLGLAVSKKIIEEHEGELIVDSTEGEGTTFTMVIPGNLVQKTEKRTTPKHGTISIDVSELDD